MRRVKSGGLCGVSSGENVSKSKRHVRDWYSFPATGVIECLLLAILVSGSLASSTLAQTFTFTGSNNNSLTASVSFAQSGNDLIVTLANTTAADTLMPSQVLTAVFFTLAGHPTLTKISAVVAPGSVTLFGTNGPAGDVGGEWAYMDTLTNAPGGSMYGLSSSGFSAGPMFGTADEFEPGDDLNPNSPSPDGLDYGLVSWGDNPATGNNAVTGKDPLIKHAVVLTLGLPVDYVLTADKISAVNFQYGTSLTEPNIPGVLIPEPSTIALVTSGILLLALVRRRKR
jgi:hypothetical protein